MNTYNQEITFNCNDKNVSYLKNEIFRHSQMLQNLQAEFTNELIESVEIPFESSEVVIMFNYFYSVGWYGSLYLKVEKLDLYLRILDLIDFFDFDNKKDIFETIGKHIHLGRYLSYTDICYDKDIKIENDFKNCLKFIFA